MEKIYCKCDRKTKEYRLKGGPNGYAQMVLSFNAPPVEDMKEKIDNKSWSHFANTNKEIDIKTIIDTLIGQRVDSILLRNVMDCKTVRVNSEEYELMLSKIKKIYSPSILDASAIELKERSAAGEYEFIDLD